MQKIALLQLLNSQKLIWFKKKFEWQKNPSISTQCYRNVNTKSVRPFRLVSSFIRLCANPLGSCFRKKIFFFWKKKYFFELSTIFSVLRNSISPFGLLNPLLRIILTLKVHCQTSMSFTPNFLRNVYLRGRSVSAVTFIKLLISNFSNFVIYYLGA